MTPKAIRHVAADASAVILVCRKCSKRLDGGFGPDGDERLAKVLRRSLRSASPKARRARQLVVEVPCLDLCPRGTVVVLRGDRPGDWLLVPRGASMTEVHETLGLAEAEKTEA